MPHALAQHKGSWVKAVVCRAALLRVVAKAQKAGYMMGLGAVADKAPAAGLNRTIVVGIWAATGLHPMPTAAVLQEQGAPLVGVALWADRAGP